MLVVPREAVPRLGVEYGKRDEAGDLAVRLPFTPKGGFRAEVVGKGGSGMGWRIAS